jgi:hypothetical protein
MSAVGFVYPQLCFGVNALIYLLPVLQPCCQESGRRLTH